MRYRMFSHISLGLFIGLSASLALAGTVSKKNVCSITINSSDEIELFKKGLSEKEFNFVELTLTKSKDQNSDSGGEENNWLKESCKQGITCDMLVISGHFGGSFFGESGLSLPLETLEKASCDNTCSGVLHNPKEVFLFGCNTLAGKERDRRTPEQYAQVLMQDGFSRTQAQQVAAFRYSALGSSFSDRMSRIFSKVPRIYGFSSIAPSGKNAAPYLRNYLKGAAPTYFDYLANVSKEVNSSLKENFKVTALTQTAGSSNTNTPVCYIENSNLSNEAKLSYILEVVDKGGILELAPFLVSYFEQLDTKSLTAKETELLGKIYANENGKGRLNSFLEKPIDGLLKPQVDMLNLMVKLNWISNQGYDQQISNLVLGPFYEKPKVTLELADQICSMNLNVTRIAAEQIKEANWKNHYFYRALKCLKPTNKELLEVVATRITPFFQIIEQNKKSNKNEFETVDLVKSVLELFGKSKHKGPKAIEAIGAALTADPHKFSYPVETYIEESGTVSAALRQKVEAVLAQYQDSKEYNDTGINKALQRALLMIARKDKAFIEAKIEKALNEKEPYLKVGNGERFQYLMNKSDSHRNLIVREVQESKDFNRMDSALLMMDKFAKPELQMLPHLAGLVNGAYPITTRMLSLKVINSWARNIPSWKSFFLNVVSGKAPYQVKRLAWEALSDWQNNLSESELNTMLAVETDIRLRRQIIQRLLIANEEKYKHIPEISPLDTSSQVFADLKAGKIPYTIFTDSYDGDESSAPFKMVTAVLDLPPGTMPNSNSNFTYAYGFDEAELLINTKNNAVVAMVTDTEWHLNFSFDQASRMASLSESGKGWFRLLGLLELNKNLDAVEQDYSEALEKLEVDLGASLKAEKKKYARIIDSGGIPSVELGKMLKPNTHAITFSSYDEEDMGLNGEGKVQLVPGPKGKGTIKLLTKKVLNADG